MPCLTFSYIADYSAGSFLQSQVCWFKIEMPRQVPLDLASSGLDGVDKLTSLKTP